MSEQNITVNVEEIMREIRAEIKEKGLDSSMLSFEDVPMDGAHAVPAAVSPTGAGFDIAVLNDCAGYLEAHDQIDPYKPIAGNPVFVFVKKVIRKLLKFYMVPIISEQNAINRQVTNAVRQMSLYAGGNDRDINTAELMARLEELELRQEANKKEIEALRKQVAVLSEENKSLKS